MPATEHAHKNIKSSAAIKRALFENGTTFEALPAVCFRCQRPINGFGFWTLYGSLQRPDGKLYHACGELVHHRCPPETAGRRVVDHNPGEFGASHGKWRTRNIAPGVDEILGSGRYTARHNKKRLGVFDTRAQAQQALNLYKQELAHAARRKHNPQKETPNASACARASNKRLTPPRGQVREH